MLRQFAALLVSFLAALNATASDYNGFHIDEHLLDAGQRAVFTGAPSASVIEQLKIVESVGLPPAVLEGLKKTRINVDPNLSGQPGIFAVRNGEGAVWIRPIVFPSNKPILLHELLHAYHFNVLTMRNREVQQAYERAQSGGLFPPAWQSSHFLQNAKEYFAVTGTLYLFGDIQQPPFHCAELAKLGADYLAFLAAQFGPHECNGGAAHGQQ